MTAVVQVNGLELAYEDVGEGDPFVLVHGFTGSGRDWVSLTPELARDRRVIAVHQRGHGDSSNTGDPASYTFDLLVSDLAALLDALGLERFDLLGHSMGGLVAMRYAVDHPGRVRSLIPMDTGASPTPGAIVWFQPLIDLVNSGGMQAYCDAVKPYSFPDGKPADACAAFEWAVMRMDPVAFARFAVELTTYPSFLSELKSLAMPTTVVVGENDVSLRGAADDLAANIPGAVLDVIPDAAHCPNWENKPAWLAAVARHFERIG